jgi:hypothetical protein
MAYGEKYKYYFYWDHDSSNNYYKVSFLIDGYASTVTELTPGPNPFIHSIKGQSDTLDNPIMGSEAKMEIIVKGSGFAAIDTDFIESDYKDVIVKLIEDPDGTPINKWIGFMLPTSTNRNWLGNDKRYSLAAVDGLADLKNFYYSSSGLDTGAVYTGFEDMLTIIKTALSKVATISELQLDIQIQLGTFSDQMTSTENAFKESEIVQELFYESKDGENQIDTCYTVLQKVLGVFYCTLVQRDGYYRITNISERTTYVFEYDWTTLTQQSRTLYGRSKSVSLIDFFDRGQLYKLPGFDNYFVTLKNKEYNPELLTNGNFDSNVTGWTNGDADDSSNTWTFFGWFNDPGIGGTLKTTYSGSATAGKYNFHTTSTFTIEVGTGKQNVNVTVVAKYSDTNPTGLSDPKILMRLYNGTDGTAGYVTGTKGAQTVTSGVGGYVTYTDSFDVTGMTVTANYLDVEIEATDALTEVIEFTFDSISLVQETSENPTDWKHRGRQSTSTQYATKEVEIYIADQQESDNDICAIKDAGGTYTSTWSRYNTTDDIPLIEILQQYAFNSNYKPMSYVTTTVYDPGQLYDVLTLYFYDVGVYFRVIGMDVNYRKATLTLNLKEDPGYPAAADIAFTNSRRKLTSKYGQSQD